ncbi:YitT family protein [Paenibacillus sp. P26]|nr:YitT family protein [Paenibacillus sp. P26]
MQRLGRGVTYLNGEGGFSGELKRVIFVVITRLEEAKLKSIVEELDPSAFLAVGNIHDVKGEDSRRRISTRPFETVKPGRLGGFFDPDLKPVTEE